MWTRLLLIVVIAWATFTAQRVDAQTTPACTLPDATIVSRDGNAVLQSWDLPFGPVWFSETLPNATGYRVFRAAIRAAGGDQEKPVADPQGSVGSIQCLEAALFAVQDARYSELSQPTEFIAHVLLRNDRLRVYFGAGDQMYPPKSVDGFREVERDVADGWRYLAALHNHTVQTRGGRLAPGAPAPNRRDVELFRRLDHKLELRAIRVTNGLYTGVVRTADLPTLHTRD